MRIPGFESLDPGDLAFFGCVGTSTSLASAARKMDITPSAVTQRLQQLEKRLGIILLYRQRKCITLTPEGEFLLKHSPDIVRACNALTEELFNFKGKLTGSLFILAPFGFGRKYISSIVSSFREKHPFLNIELHLCDSPMANKDSHWDVIIHIGEVKDSTMIAHKLANNKRVTCASPIYLKNHGTPIVPEDLQNHDCIVLRENLEDVTLWQYKKDNKTRSVRIRPILASNDGEIVRDWAIKGHGIAIRSEWDVVEQIRQGKLIQLLSGYETMSAPILALLFSATAKPFRTQQFLDFLKSELSPVPPWRV